MNAPVAAGAIGAGLVAAYLGFLGRQLARRNQQGGWFDGFSAGGWAALGTDADAVTRQVRADAPGMAGGGEASAAAAWVRALRIRRAAVFLGPGALAEAAGLPALAAAGRVDLWLLVPIAPTDDAAADERAIIGGLRAIFPPQGVHPAGLRLLRPDGARFLLAFASADRNARGQALGLKAAEFLIQGARRGAPPTPPAPPCRSPRGR